MKNKQYKLAERPVGLVKPTDWKFEESDVPDIEDGQVLVQVIYISLDPAMRGWMDQARSYVPPVRIGQVMRAGTLGKVVASKNAAFSEGDYVTGIQGVQQFARSNGDDLEKVDASAAPLPQYLGALGMPGMTAYFGILDVGSLSEGDKVVVSGAAGAVGSVVGQIAKLKNCEVLGIAGGEKKCDYVVNELGFDACIDYKNQDVARAIKKHYRKGLDVYFDNVGGDILEAALFNIARGARIVICGAIAQYNASEPSPGPRNYLSLLINRARMEGFVVFDYADRYAEGQKDIAAWIKSDKLKAKEDIYEGIENFPDVFMKLFTGENFGKLLLKVGEE